MAVDLELERRKAACWDAQHALDAVAGEDGREVLVCRTCQVVWLDADQLARWSAVARAHREVAAAHSALRRAIAAGVERERALRGRAALDRLRRADALVREAVAEGYGEF